MTLEGIDVSSWNGYVNWGNVRASGKVFAMMKATEGLGYQDPSFDHNWLSTLYRGLTRISYHYLHPNESGTDQADYHHAFVRAHGHFRIGDGCMIDLEETDGASPLQVIQCAEEFANRILATTHCGVFLYTYPDFWNNQIGGPESATLARCPLVIASYGAPPGALHNWPNGPSMWQYSSTGHVPGVVGECDLDRFLGTRQQLDVLCREGGRH